jgi:hypothetical protein
VRLLVFPVADGMCRPLHPFCQPGRSGSLQGARFS